MITETQAEKYWRTKFQQLIDETQVKTNTIPSDWRSGGRATKAYPNKENDIWWSEHGPKMVQNFMTWWTNSGWEVYTGKANVPHIEAEFSVYFGDVSVRAIADLIAVTPEGELVVIDYKTGTYMPDSNMQLGLYAACMELTSGVRPTKGFFYNARHGVMEDAGDLSRWTVPLFTELFKQFEKAVQEQIFLPYLGMACKTCAVSQYCYAYGGEHAKKYDPLASIDEGK